MSERRDVRGLVWLAALVATCFAATGVGRSAFLGLPLGPIETVTIAAVVTVALVFRTVAVPASVMRRAAAAMLLLFGARLIVGFAASPVGWSARYFSNDTWSGTPEWSSDFRTADATRVDRRISFKNDELPAHFLNDRRFDRGMRREVTEPLSIEWRGYADVDADRSVRAALKARGSATLAIDGRVLLAVSSTREVAAADGDLHVSPGVHALSVRYVKPADTDAAIDVDLPLRVVADANGRARRAFALQIADVALEVALVAVFAAVAAFAVRRGWNSSRAVPLVLFAAFGAQGAWQAWPLATRVVSLTSGDDWFGFESSAREILHHGPLMSFGKALGSGEPYFYHPLYCYFLAAVHALAGESLFGPVFVQFLILAAVAAIVWRFAAERFGWWPALAGLFALVSIFELDFVRYYTITLLSENLYILTVTLTLVPFSRWIDRGNRGDLVRAAFWGGVSSITRPSMMVFFVPALALVAFVAASRLKSLGKAAAAVVTAAAIWLAVIAPITIRNAAVSGRFVLISEGLGATFIKYNTPASADPSAYAQQYSGSVFSGFAVLARIARDHPMAMLATQGRKLGFSLGMVHWHEGYRPHPELIAVTFLYAAAIVASPALRRRLFWPIHLFVLSHLASMGLTMPWNYGYRLIIPPFVYTSALSTAALCALVAMRLPAISASRPSESRA